MNSKKQLVLYIFWFLHQTTTGRKHIKSSKKLYIFWFLHQTTTCLSSKIGGLSLYIFWFLHQTTTSGRAWNAHLSCISFDSYIKPQPVWAAAPPPLVVYLLIPTSNHNCFGIIHAKSRVVYLLIPTSNHNSDTADIATEKLYIFWFLHQTTTVTMRLRLSQSCISFDSYIKPQPAPSSPRYAWVVYLLIPTSNHNFDSVGCVTPSVVYLLIPTSNHNLHNEDNNRHPLYIFWFLHQTTTSIGSTAQSLALYIFWFLHQTTTCSSNDDAESELYIFWFLHQTTTPDLTLSPLPVLYIFWFLHQTTTHGLTARRLRSCISFDSYIKPQHGKS